MNAVIVSGGNQYKVKQDQIIRLEKIEVDSGADIKFENVLMLSSDNKIQIGTPYIDKCEVVATVLKHARDKKINIIKFKRRKHHMKRMGHRQWFTEVKIKIIKFIN